MANVHLTTLAEPEARDAISSQQRFESTGRTGKHKHRCRPFSPSRVDIGANHRSQWDTRSHTQRVLSVPNNLHRHRHLHAHHYNPQHRKFESSSSRPNQVYSSTSSSNTESVSDHKCPQRRQMRTKSLISQFVSYKCVFTVVSLLCAISCVAEAFTCPPVNLIHRLQSPNGASVNRMSQPTNQTPECDCTIIQEGGWEINCYATSNENDESKSKWSGPKDFESLDYNIDYNILIVSFSIRYVIGRQVKITCDHGAPVFKPALFQGFGVESIDTFIISNCELPLTLPLSVILYRTTPKHVFSISSKIGDSSYAINTTTNGNNENVAPLKALYLTTPKAVTIQQLNTLLSDLESLEQLTLNDFNLNDVDDYSVESVDRAMVSEHPRRVSRAVNASESNTISSMMEVETTTLSSIAHSEVTTIDAKTLTTASNESVEVTTQLPIVELAELDSVKNETLEVTTTSMSIEVTTKLPISEQTDSVEVNSTRSGIESNDVTADEDINELNVENKPIVTLDENALNFARILPSLRILRLRHFVKESSIPNVVFQIIKGLNKLEYLELDSNTLNQIPSNALSFAGPNLKKLYLYKNSIKEISENAFLNLTRLEILDLSQNQLSQLEDYTLKPLKSLLYLSLRNNQLQSLSEYVFQSNSKLVSLDLSQNRQLEPLPGNLLTGLNSLANFSLAYCNISQVSNDIQQLFRNVPNLSKLELKGNQLANLTLSGLFAWNSKLSILDASANQITEINHNIFSSNSSQISEINLNKNRLTELTDNLFINARNLRKLSVAFNDLRQTSPMMFIHLRSLEELNLSRNKITTLNTQENQLPFGIGGSLRKVDLSFNNLTNFDTEINGVNWHLYLLINELNLKSNHFNGTLTVPVFSSSIEPTIDLDLSSNKFTAVEVKHLLVDWNFELTEDAFSDSSSTNTNSWETQVRLDNNPIECNCLLFPFLKYTKTTGRLFSKNSHSILRKTVFIMDSSDGLTCDTPEQLRDRPLNHLQLDELVCRINDHRICPKECSCLYRSVDQAAIIDCDNSGLVQLPPQLELSRYFNISVDEANSTISEVDNVILQLRNNSIESIDSLTSMFVWTTNMKRPSFMEIWLDHNNISSIEENLIPVESSVESMPLLRALSLRDNSLTYVPLLFLDNFEKHALPLHLDARNSTNVPTAMDRHNRPIESKLYLGRNPINCYNEARPVNSDCYIRDFKTWLSTHPNRLADVETIQCDSLSVKMPNMNETNLSLVILNMTDNLLCPVLPPPSNSGPIIALSIICVALASSLFVVSVLYYRNKQTILAFIYIHLNPIFICLSFTENDLDEEKIYDAFVSYSSSDRDIVMELIEKLEKPQDMSEANLILQNGSISVHEEKLDQIVPENEYKKSCKEIDTENANDGQVRYRLCIHERDWLPGNLISWNIVNSVQNSKRTILVLSQSFIKSIWFQVEFHTAYYQMLEDKMDRLIVIVRGELPPKEEMDKDLMFLLTTKTYLVWGEKWFWEKLYYAMPHKKKQNVTQFGKQAKCEHKKMANGKNGVMNGSAHKDGMLKWSSKGAQDYVDKTIASHFQLNNLSHPIQQQPNGHDSKPAPKSLRNSGTLSNATPATLQAFNNNRNAAYDNKSFINETNT